MTAVAEGSKPSSCAGGCVMPRWINPADQQTAATNNGDNTKFISGLKVLNSLTRNTDLFVPMSNNKQIYWYSCGPTVYAPSHMGHARTYLAFDIVRRLLQDYFGYTVTLVMNITDLDDKIIERANEQGITHSELSKKFEAEYHKDMKDLGVLPPTILTRVTEYMPEITNYIQQIVDKKLAYESNGSVYFDTRAFSALPDMHYGKLEPNQIGNAELLAEGEGKLSQEFVHEKRHATDFALWKKSKEGEPSWPSPWGPGRPGWHIECSVMASDALQKLSGQPCMDIHSGGVDLKFPHHDNELAQSEACSGKPQWVNYFLHSGHLHIQGLKMSKSLKNFITIQQALEINSARQIRLLFLLHKYNTPMDYGDSTMSHALELERKLVQFFHTIKATLRQLANNGWFAGSQHWNEAAIELQKTLQTTQQAVDAALKDDFDTKSAVTLLVDLMKSTNVYLDSTTTTEKQSLVLRNVATYIAKLFGVLGVELDTAFLTSSGGAANSENGATNNRREQVLQPVLDALLEFRSQVRDAGRAGDSKKVLEACDAFRDEILPPLGIRLEDKSSAGCSMWKLDDPATLQLEQAQKAAAAQAKAEAKAAQEAEAQKKAALNKLSPTEYLKQLTLEDGVTLQYSKFDEATGKPTADGATGEPLNKNQTKKMEKMYKAQQTKYDKYMKSQQN